MRKDGRETGREMTERKREDSVGEYVDLHNDSPRDFSRYVYIKYICVSVCVYTRDSLSSITSEAVERSV